MKNKVTALVLILMIAASPLAFGGAFASPFGAPADTASVSGYEQSVVQLVNSERAKAGLDLLYMDNNISNAARLKSKDMADLNCFAHYSHLWYGASDMMLKYDSKELSSSPMCVSNSSMVSTLIILAVLLWI